MRKIHVVTMARLNRALDRVVPELDRHGFWDERVEGLDVYLVPIGAPYGWQYFGRSGEIGIPSVSLCKLLDWWQGNYIALADVLRHEYGHAVADTHRGLINSRQFIEAFGASHIADVEWDYDPFFHLTPYASSCPASRAPALRAWRTGPRKAQGTPTFTAKSSFNRTGRRQLPVCCESCAGRSKDERPST